MARPNKDDLSFHLELRPDELIVDVKKQMKPGVKAAGQMMAAAVRQDLSSPGPSQEGEAPGVDSGRLRDSVVSRSIGGGLGFRIQPKDRKLFPVIGRLQKGFHGRDAAGRLYEQMGRPVYGPALTRLADEIAEKMARG